jgi:hypothetical protein
MAEAGFIQDPRCQPALELLASKQLPEGGFPAEVKYYRTSEKAQTGRSLVNWASYTLPGNKIANQFVTLDALYVLKEAGIDIFRKD